MMSVILNELTRGDLIKSSKVNNNFNRYLRRNEVSNIRINRVGIIEVVYFDQPDLDLYFEVEGKYRVSLRLIGFLDDLRDAYAKNSDKVRFEGGISKSGSMRKLVFNTLKQCVSREDVKVDCSCPDMYYRFSYLATVKGYKFGEDQLISAPVRNPNGDGSACKHVIKVLTQPSMWMSKVTTGIMTMIRKKPQILLKK